MKILYIGDNRCRGNYGCRATSTALSMLIGAENEIVGRVTGNVTFFYPRVFYFKYFPGCIYKLLGRIKYWDKIQPLMARINFKLGLVLKKGKWFDFVSHDMDKSIRNLKRCLPANPILKELDLEQYDFDAVVVNGEGSFVFSTPQWREPLVITMCMYWALMLGKKVFLMNAMFSDSPSNERNMKTLELVENIFSRCNIVVAREQVSFDYVKDNLKSLSPVLIPDALFTWYDLVNDNHNVADGKYYLAHVAESDSAYSDFDFTKPYILVSGSSARIIGENKEKAIQAYSSLIKRLKESCNETVFLIQVCEGDEFLNQVAKYTNTPIISMETPIIAAAKILANATAYVSGRYHPAIMASLGGTPCVFMGSNSHKTWSLQQLLEYPEIVEYGAIPDENEITEIVSRTLHVSNNPEIREKIKNRAYILCSEAKKMVNYIK